MIPAPGFLRLVDHMGSDASICRAARLSYGRADAERTSAEDERLIRYLLRHRHTSPFEQAVIQIHVKLPIFVARQWMRHRTWAYNEVSARYSELPDEVFIPDALHEQSSDNKQGRGGALTGGQGASMLEVMRHAYQTASNVYHALLYRNVSREQARAVLPVAQYTEFVATVNLHNALHFLKLRTDAHAQAEIRAYADALAGIVEGLFPATYRAWVDYSRDAVTLTRAEVEAVRAMIKGCPPDLTSLSDRERRALLSLFPMEQRTPPDLHPSAQ